MGQTILRGADHMTQWLKFIASVWYRIIEKKNVITQDIHAHPAP